jgi:carbonic anhydrase/acetyltransferase-like protein (isoleucine patch superfamily)
MATLTTTLIGDGSHAVDIAHTYQFDRHIPHHAQFTDDGGRVCIGANDPQLRAWVAGEIGVRDSAWVHPRAWIGPETEFGYGTHINYLASMTRTRIGRHCTISPGVTICGDVIIGDRVLVGAGAVISDRVTIGDDAVIGAGTVVLPATVINDGETWVGVPARRL